MKKLFLTSVVLMTALMAQAQTKIAPKLEEGFKAVYVNKTTVSMMGKEGLAMCSEDEYAVSDVNAEGAVITVTNLNSSDIPTEGLDPVSMMIYAMGSMLKGTVVKVKVDADGVPQSVLNIDEVKEKMLQAMTKAVDGFYASTPELSQVMSKEQFVEQFSDQVTNEDDILKGFEVLALNGKTVANGYQDSYTNDDGMKMKRMYFIAGKKIISNATLDMSKDELKEFIIKQVEKEAPEQAQMVKENIDMLMSQLKFDATEKHTYQLLDNGWPASVTTEKTQESMGQSMKSTSVIELKK